MWTTEINFRGAAEILRLIAMLPVCPVQDPLTGQGKCTNETPWLENPSLGSYWKGAQFCVQTVGGDRELVRGQYELDEVLEEISACG